MCALWTFEVTFSLFKSIRYNIVVSHEELPCCWPLSLFCHGICHDFSSEEKQENKVCTVCQWELATDMEYGCIKSTQTQKQNYTHKKATTSLKCKSAPSPVCLLEIERLWWRGCWCQWWGLWWCWCWWCWCWWWQWWLCTALLSATALVAIYPHPGPILTAATIPKQSMINDSWWFAPRPQRNWIQFSLLSSIIHEHPKMS